MPFNNVSDPEIMAKSAMVAEAFTPEKCAYLLSLFPTSEDFTELHNKVEANYTAFLKGDPEKVKEFEADRKTLNSFLSLLLGLAKVASAVDPKVQESIGLGRPTEKIVAGTVHLAAPQGFKVVFDPKGRLTASINKVTGAKGYQIWACESEPATEANWRLVASSTKCKGIVVLGLNRGKFNLLRIRAIRGNDAGPWSNWVSLDPNQ
jgi:hypothetical protein